MSTEVVKQDNYELMEKFINDGDLSKLTPKERITYYLDTCKSLGLNHLTRPFQYIKFNGKVVLYAAKDATEQLRKIHKISIVKLEKETIDGVYIITAYARNSVGQEDVSTGAVTISGLKGEALSNAFLKAETKAKRRVTLSICGLGMTDESEVNSIPNQAPVSVNYETGEIKSEPKSQFDIDEVIIILKELATLDELKEVYDAYKGFFRDRELKRLVDYKDQRKLEIMAQAAKTTIVDKLPDFQA